MLYQRRIQILSSIFRVLVHCEDMSLQEQLEKAAKGNVYNEKTQQSCVLRLLGGTEQLASIAIAIIDHYRTGGLNDEIKKDTPLIC